MINIQVVQDVEISEMFFACVAQMDNIVHSSILKGILMKHCLIMLLLRTLTEMFY